MANELSMAQRDTVLALLGQGWSRRKVARELGLHRETVRRYAKLIALHAGASGGEAWPEDGGRAAWTGGNAATPTEVATGSRPAQGPPNAATPAKVATGSEGTSAPAPSSQRSAPPGVAPGRSQCEPFRGVIEAKLEAGLSAQRIYQDLVSEHGFAAAYNSVKRFVRGLSCDDKLPFRRLECAPGAEAQIDFGSGAPILMPDGKLRRPHVLRLVLGHSRKGYSQAVLRQTADDLLACCENAFWTWGGVPRTLVIDNLKAAVLQADWYDPELHPKLSAFCKHYGTVLLPTKVRTPRHKGKIERGIGYVQSNALKGCRFESLAAHNTHLAHWESTIADLRIHGTTKRQVRQVFEEVERPALLSLPSERFPFFHEAQRVVHKDGHVEVAKAYYSVPPEYLGRTVWVRWDSRVVRVFNARFVEIALHPRQELGRFSSAPQHISSSKIALVERGATELLRRARLIGPQAGRWAEAMLKARGIEGVRVLVGLLALLPRHPVSAVERACELALGHGQFRLRALRALMREPLAQEQLEFMSEHPVIRSIKAYGALVQVSFDPAQPWREPPVAPPSTPASAAEER